MVLPLRKSLKKIPASEVKRISAKIDALLEKPRPDGCKKVIGEELWRVRAGDYRIVYVIDDETKTIDIRRIRHRKDVYKKQ